MPVTPKFVFSSPTFPLNSRFLYLTAYMMFPSVYLVLFLNQTLDPSPNLTSPSKSPWLIQAKSYAIVVDSSLFSHLTVANPLVPTFLFLEMSLPSLPLRLVPDLTTTGHFLETTAAMLVHPVNAQDSWKELTFLFPFHDQNVSVPS